MKILFNCLLGTGVLGLLFTTYLTLEAQSVVKRELRLDQAKMSVEKARFDQSFETAWASFNRADMSAEEQHHLRRKVGEAEQALEEQIGQGRGELVDRQALKALIDQ